MGLGSEYGPGSGVGSPVRSREWGIRVREEHVICRVVVGMGEWELDMVQKVGDSGLGRVN